MDKGGGESVVRFLGGKGRGKWASFFSDSLSSIKKMNLDKK